jgi:hypothetical protein
MNRALWAAALAALAAGPPAAAEDAAPTTPATVKKTKQQLHFQVPADWPIEERAGVVGPIPVEEYLALKFQQLETRLQALEQRLNGFDLRLRILEEGSRPRSTSQGLRSSETIAP